MNKEQAIAKYSNKYLKDYKDADDCIWINISDQDLHPVKLLLPPCPNWDKIDNLCVVAVGGSAMKWNRLDFNGLEEDISERTVNLLYDG